MFQSSAFLPSNPISVKVPTGYHRIPANVRRKNEFSIVSSFRNRNQRAVSQSLQANSMLLTDSSSSFPVIRLARNLGFHPSPELGFISLLFVLTTAVGAIISLAIISLPALNAFRRLAVSVDKLSKVVSEEVPGTLSSLKLSGLEISDLTCQLSNLRQRITGNQYGKKERVNKPWSSRGRNNPIID